MSVCVLIWASGGQEKKLLDSRNLTKTTWASWKLPIILLYAHRSLSIALRTNTISSLFSSLLSFLPPFPLPSLPPFYIPFSFFPSPPLPHIPSPPSFSLLYFPFLNSILRSNPCIFHHLHFKVFLIPSFLIFFPDWNIIHLTISADLAELDRPAAASIVPFSLMIRGSLFPHVVAVCPDEYLGGPVVRATKFPAHILWKPLLLLFWLLSQHWPWRYSPSFYIEFVQKSY